MYSFTRTGSWTRCGHVQLHKDRELDHVQLHKDRELDKVWPCTASQGPGVEQASQGPGVEQGVTMYSFTRPGSWTRCGHVQLHKDRELDKVWPCTASQGPGVGQGVAMYSFTRPGSWTRCSHVQLHKARELDKV
ncbi:hypothetical protein BaRGS_00035473 [Batillaria attramentaria]|uniref:Uncharacterized protein n=1 Tax=Batillaria attramentaria TaxID=370345 RepID=A0ABD0JED2_9CAEN